MLSNYNLIENTNKNYKKMQFLQNNINFLEVNKTLIDRKKHNEIFYLIYKEIYTAWIYKKMTEKLLNKYIINFVNNEKFFIIKDLIDNNLNSKKYEEAYRILISFMRRKMYV
ncbi:hypothetical protein [Mycoplasma sp. 1018B]|uniref:hypothetical protein n=1 Tax=Mycoplasma sp. 1018B TaxID=2967302 RepID=UPI00211CBA5A|nr:hypothetical protein [Mycoplasma sp. 1018B]UUM19154.1 hypothetical protein NPA14_02365 [Mycoplasma sp. 1018B]